MCGGKDDRPQMQRIPDPPSEKEMMNFINYITGSQTVTATGPNGVRQRITTRLPRSAERQKALEMGEDLVVTSIDQLGKLFKYDPQSSISFAPLIDTFADMDNERLGDLAQFANFGDIEARKQQFKEMQKTLIDEQFSMRERANEERLAHSGRGSGTYAAESRAAMARAHGLARMEGDAKAEGYAEDLSAKRLATHKEGFGLREAGRQGTLEATQADYALNKADEQDQETRRQTALQERMGQFNVGSEVRKYDDWLALQDKTHDQALGTYLAENNVQNARYGQQVNAIAANNRAAQEEYASRPPSFGEWAVNTGTRLGAAYLSGGASEAGGLSKMFGGTGTNNDSRVGADTTGIMYPGKRK